MRADERFVADQIARHLGVDPAAHIQDGEDPPDCYITADGVRNAVEITRLTPISFDKAGTPKNRVSEDSFGIELCESLDANEGKQLPDDYSLLLHLRVPVDNATAYKKLLTVEVRKFIERGPAAERYVLSQDAISVSLSWIPRRETGKRIVGMIENTDARPDILENALIVLRDRLVTKNDICAKLADGQPIWLALLNDYWLADETTYGRALARIECKHCFTRIWLVSHEEK